MVNVLGELVVAIKGDASSLNNSLRQSIKEAKEATAGFRDLGKIAFRMGTILTAFGAGVLLFLKSSFDTLFEVVGSPELQEAMIEFDDLIREIQLTLAEALAPALTFIIETVTDFIKGFKDAHPELFNFMVVALAIGGVLAALIGGFLIFAGAIASSAVAIGLTGAAISAFVTTILFPLMAILGIFFLLWRFGFLDLKAIAENTFKGISDIFSGFSKLLKGDFSGLSDILMGIWRLTFGNFLIVMNGFVKKGIEFGITLAKILVGAFFDIRKHLTEILVNTLNFLSAKMEGFLNGLIAAFNQISAIVGGPQLGPISLGKVEVEPILAGIATERATALERLETSKATQLATIELAQDIILNIDTLFVDSDRRMEDIASRVGDIIAGRVNNRAGITPLAPG